ETLARLGALTPTPQRQEDATLAPRLKRTDGYLDWSRSARELVNVVRGCNPWPGALTRGPAGPLLIWRAIALVSAHTHAAGTLERPTAEADYPAIATSDGWLCPVEVQPENRRAMSWSDYLRGARLAPRSPRSWCTARSAGSVTSTGSWRRTHAAGSSRSIRGCACSCA